MTCVEEKLAELQVVRVSAIQNKCTVSMGCGLLDSLRCFITLTCPGTCILLQLSAKGESEKRIQSRDT